MSPELTQLATAAIAAVGGVSVWRCAQYVIGRIFDERERKATSIEAILKDRDERIERLEAQVAALQRELRQAENRSASMETEMAWLRQFCAPRQQQAQGGSV